MRVRAGRPRSDLASPANVEACDAYLNTLEAAERHAMLEARDAWGATPLFRALDRPDGDALVAVLFRHGPGAARFAGPMGMTPRMCAQVHRRPAQDMALGLLGSPACLGSFQEASWRSLLAHMFGLDGITYLDAQRLSLSGGWPVQEHIMLGKALRSLAETSPAVLLPVHLDAMADAFLRVADHMGAGTHRLEAFIRQGAAVVLPTLTRHRDHVVDYAWYAGYAARCDRASPWPWLRRRTCRLLNVTASHNPAMLRALQESLYGVSRTHFKHREAASSPLSRYFAKQRLRRQQVNNCSMASAKAALFFFLAVDAYRRNDLAAAYPQYKMITTYSRFYILKHYVLRHLHGTPEPYDEVLLQRCWRKLEQPRRAVYLLPAWRRELHVLRLHLSALRQQAETAARRLNL